MAKFFKYVKTFLKLCFSPLGTSCVVVLYTLLGAWMFQALESPYERYATKKKMELHEQVLKSMNDSIQTILFLAKNPEDYEENSIKRVDEILQYTYLESIFVAANSTGAVENGTNWPSFFGSYDGNEPTNKNVWGYGSAVLFCVTILTTIGFGHVCPITERGRLIFVIYGIFAIPLMSIFLMQISNILAGSLQTFYEQCRKKYKRWSSKTSDQSQCVTNTEKASGASPDLVEKFQHFDVKLYMESLDMEEWCGLLIMIVETLIDICLYVINTWSGTTFYHLNAETHVFYIFTDSDNQQTSFNGEVQLPILIIVVILIIYILLGAGFYMLTKKSEDQDGSFVKAIYVSVISITTIGLENSSKIDNWVLLLYSIYLLIGISLLALCTSLFISSMENRFSFWIDY